MLDDSNHYLVALSDVCSPHIALRPPKRITVAQGAAENLQINQPGGYVGPWSAEETPYMVEPMNMLASRQHEAVCFVGPARTGKTMALLDGWLSHVVVNDPGDMLIVQMTQDKAREFSKVRIDRALRHSPKLEAMKSHSSQDDNTHDKLFRHGMWLRIGWPTVPNLSSSEYRYVGLTDYDRMPDDVDGEGSPFALGLKRTTTYLSRGMCAVESSPGRLIKDPNWKPATPHEAPPTGGIFGIYNRSDRRRWYWQCLDCNEHFEAAPGLSLFRLPKDEELIEMVRAADLEVLSKEYAKLYCPHCGSAFQSKHKKELNSRGLWLQDGLRITQDREVIGTPINSSIAGYWMGGVAAAYQSWKSLVMRYMQGLREYSLTGSELTLQTTVNTDQGAAYMTRHLLEAARSSRSPADRTNDKLQRFIVPEWARFVVTSVDVQGGSNARFVVQSHAIGPFMEQALIDRYTITKSERQGVGEDFAPIDPAVYAEDWDILTKRVVKATYKTAIEGKELRVKLVVCDTGGEAKKKGAGEAIAEGVTEKSYAWYRRLRKEQLASRVMLIKGNNTMTDWLIKETMVGRRHTNEPGDVPLYLLNPNRIKDAVSAGIKRQTPGPTYRHFPKWLPQAFFDELGAEVRNENGVWEQIKPRNEAWDLCCYIHAGCLKLNVDKLTDWDAVPSWMKPLAENSDLITREERQELHETPLLAPAERTGTPEERANVQRKRRVAHSAYLG